MKKRIFSALLVIPIVLYFFLQDNSQIIHFGHLIFSFLLARELLQLYLDDKVSIIAPSKKAVSMKPKAIQSESKATQTKSRAPHPFSSLQSKGIQTVILCTVIFFSILMAMVDLVFSSLASSKNNLLTIYIIIFFFTLALALTLISIFSYRREKDNLKLEQNFFANRYRDLCYGVMVFLISGPLLYHVVMLKYISPLLLPSGVMFQRILSFPSNPYIPFQGFSSNGVTAGEAYILYGCILVWGFDSLAYLFGKKWGTKKLPNFFSPNKSYAGLYVGGAFTLLLLTGIYSLLTIWHKLFLSILPGLDGLPIFDSPSSFLICSILLIYVGFLGDLFGSLLKRMAGKKDSGNFMPGHGGLLDRIDGFIFVVPSIFYLASLLSIF